MGQKYATLFISYTFFHCSGYCQSRLSRVSYFRSLPHFVTIRRSECLPFGLSNSPWSICCVADLFFIRLSKPLFLWYPRAPYFTFCFDLFRKEVWFMICTKITHSLSSYLIKRYYSPPQIRIKQYHKFVSQCAKRRFILIRPCPNCPIQGCFDLSISQTFFLCDTFLCLRTTLSIKRSMLKVNMFPNSLSS